MQKAKLNTAFLVCVLVSILVLLLWPSSTGTIYNNGSIASIFGCTHRCKESANFSNIKTSSSNGTTERAPAFLDFITSNTKIGLVNMKEDDLRDWGIRGNSIPIKFEPVSSSVAWNDLFPHGSNKPQCPELPLPDFTRYDEINVVIAKLPCKKPEDGWTRDVFRLQVHMVSANLAMRKGRRDPNGTVKVIFLSRCKPMMDIFRCDDLVRSEGEWWMYEANVSKLEDKLRLPPGTCKSALPILDEGIDNNELNASKQVATPLVSGRLEAYVTVIYSDHYVCGAIVLAQSIRRSGSTRDLVLLHDDSIHEDKLRALAAAGWILRKTTRIRNPRVKPGSIHEYSYSKFRLWQLTEYEKIVYMDCDILVLRNLDVLFSLPQMSAANNHKSIFNAGVMVIEPSICTFNALLQNRDNMTSYNDSDQGFLNEHFVSWHRIPRSMNGLKYFYENISEEERKIMEDLFAADPPKLHSIHYLGAKPWSCHKGYECNKDKGYCKRYISEAATQRWWKFYETLDESMQVYCRRPETRKSKLL